jgi:hypothetical protein
LLIDTTSLPEPYAGAGVTLLAAVSFEMARAQGVTEAHPPLRGFLRAGRVLRRVPGQDLAGEPGSSRAAAASCAGAGTVPGGAARAPATDG